MSGSAVGAAAPVGHAAREYSPWLIATVVSIATFMEVLDISIANVALRNIAGSVSASYDESTWILTSYLVANAVVLPISGWLATTFGRKRFYMLCVTVFTASSLLCGLAWSLQSLIFFRILQGIGGGGMAPSEQAILADAYPPDKRGQAFAFYALAVVVAPTIGPTLGGWITDTASWHWIFFINVPMGLLSLLLVSALVQEPAATERERQQLFRGGFRVDFVGFILVALGLGCLEVVLDEGQRNDWFSSGFILAFAVVSATALVLLVPWELRRKDPIVDIRLLMRRQFGTCFLVMLVVGAILISTTQLIPQLLQTELGNTAMLAGMVLSPGGVVLMILMPLAGQLTDRVQPRYLIALGLGVVALSMWHMTGLDGDISFSYAAWARIFTAAGLPFLFIPLATASYAGLPSESTNQAAGLFNVARNLGGSIGVALTQSLQQQREQFHNSRLVEHIIPSNIHYQVALRRVTEYFLWQGSSSGDAQSRAFEWIATTIQQQAVFLSYIDVFWVLAVVCALTVPLALVLRRVKFGDTSGPH
jgi:MFS transporter, DHA2 family, multidrug resistance protein